MASGLTWLAFKAWLKRVGAWCKKYWQLLVGAAIPIIIMLLAGQRGNVRKLLQRVNEDYEKEIDIINESHRHEIEAREEATKRYLETIEEVEKKYAEAEVELDVKKRKQIEKILKDHAEDPEEITRRIANLTGFEIYNK